MGSVERDPFKWHSTISYKLVDKIVSRGYDTTEIVEKGYGLADMVFINYQARIPLVNEAKMLNYLMILCLDDGLSPPAAIGRFVKKGGSIPLRSSRRWAVMMLLIVTEVRLFRRRPACPSSCARPR